MKNLLSIFMILTLVLSVSACSTSDAKSSDDKKNVVADDNSKESDNSEKSDNKKPGAPAEEPSNVIEGNTKENPANIGDWIKTTAYNIASEGRSVVYYRITSIERGTDKVQPYIDEHNKIDGVVKLEPITDNELEYCMLTYEVYYPKDTPSANGVVSPTNLEFYVTSKDHMSVLKDGEPYIGLRSVETSRRKLSDFETSLSPGDVYTEGKSIFKMIKGHTDYLLQEYAFDESGDKIVYSYVQGK